MHADRTKHLYEKAGAPLFVFAHTAHSSDGEHDDKFETADEKRGATRLRFYLSDGWVFDQDNCLYEVC